jgi:pantoate--beta-alanine ligase
MGNLHAGHLALMRLAHRRADRVVATIFVNPTQFGPGEDFHSYPRTLHADQCELRAAGVDALFAPEVEEIYPRGAEYGTTVQVPDLSLDLCGRFRPVHFAGVTSVVCRLFNIVSPQIAVFGEKDYQQLVILRQMTADLHLPLRIVGAATVRESDGLAMSSRNQYLSPAERKIAPGLYQSLRAGRARMLGGQRNYRAMAAQGRQRLIKMGFRPDYFEIRNAADLSMPGPKSRELRILAAAWLGRARLIDNVAVRLSA